MEVTTAFADPNLEETGAWADYREGSKIKVARIGNMKFQRALASQSRKNKANTDPERETKILCEAIAETVLLDWDGFTRNGAALPYSKDEAASLLFASMDFRNEVVEIATDMETFRNKRVGESSKNSKSGSSTS
jgi:hypothetical protein